MKASQNRLDLNRREESRGRGTHRDSADRARSPFTLHFVRALAWCVVAVFCAVVPTAAEEIDSARLLSQIDGIYQRVAESVGEDLSFDVEARPGWDLPPDQIPDLPLRDLVDPAYPMSLELAASGDLDPAGVGLGSTASWRFNEPETSDSVLKLTVGSWLSKYRQVSSEDEPIVAMMPLGVNLTFEETKRFYHALAVVTASADETTHRVILLDFVTGHLDEAIQAILDFDQRRQRSSEIPESLGLSKTGEICEPEGLSPQDQAIFNHETEYWQHTVNGVIGSVEVNLQVQCLCHENCFGKAEPLTLGECILNLKGERLRDDEKILATNYPKYGDTPEDGLIFDPQADMTWVGGAAVCAVKQCQSGGICEGTLEFTVGLNASLPVSDAGVEVGATYVPDDPEVEKTRAFGQGWCPPCRRAFPVEVQASGIPAGETVEVILVSPSADDANTQLTLSASQPGGVFEDRIADGDPFSVQILATTPNVTCTRSPDLIMAEPGAVVDIACAASSGGTHDVTANVQFDAYRVTPAGSATITLTTTDPLTGADSETRVQVEPPSKSVTVALDLADGLLFQAGILGGHENMTCAISPPGGKIDSDIVLDARCYELSQDICETLPWVCQPRTSNTCARFFYTVTVDVATVSSWGENGEPIGAETTTYYLTGSAMLCFAKSAAEVGPWVYFRNRDGSTYDSNFEVRGVAHHPAGTSIPQIYLDGSPVTLGNFQTGRHDEFVCNEVEAPCDSSSGFSGIVDISNLAEGPHTLTVYAEGGSENLESYSQITFHVDRPDRDDADIVTHTLPTSMTCGEQREATVTVRNTGTSVWSNSVCAEYKLGAHMDSDPFFDGNRRFGISSDVAPGEESTFSFVLTAPDDPGTYVTDWKMIAQVHCGGNGWFGDVAQSHVDVSCVDDAEIVSTTIPDVLDCGSSETTTITVRNRGDTTWAAADGYELVSVAGSTALISTTALGLPHDVAPGETVTFDLPLSAAATLAGPQSVSWSMSRSGQPFGPVVDRTVQVQCDNLAEVVFNGIPSQMSCGEAVDAEITMRNLGTVPWQWDDSGSGEGYLLATGVGEPLRPEAPYWFKIAPGLNVGLGETATWTLPLVAPDQPGTYTSQWQMINFRTEGHQAFGPQVTRNVRVECPALRFLGPGGGVWANGSTHHFGTIMVGDTIDRTLRFCNDGAGRFSVTSKTAVIFGGPGFVQLDANPVDVEPGTCEPFRIRFTATEAGTFDGVLSATTNEWENSPFTVTTRVSVEAPSPDLEVRVGGVPIASGGVFEFPDFVYDRVSSPPPVRFRLCNFGDGPLNIANRASIVTYSATAPFVQENIPGSSIAAGVCGYVDVSLNETKGGEFVSRLVIESNDLDTPVYEIGLVARIVAPGHPEIRVSRAWNDEEIADGGGFSFPTRSVDTLPISELFRLCNEGTDDLTLSNPGGLVSGVGFTQIGEIPPATLAPGACGDFRVRFNVLNPGTFSGAVTIHNNDFDEAPYDIQLSGTATQ